MAWTASYDTAGDLTCRAPTSATTGAGSTPTGAQLSYDNDGRLATWQNAPSSPMTTTSNLYDGAGQWVEQQVATSGTTTTICRLPACPLAAPSPGGGWSAPPSRALAAVL